jgi:VIT1/CCC1 family predicted Fe2+/Mn2+ transporter
LLPPSLRVPVTFVVVLLALALTGSISARLGGAPGRPAMTRIVIGGAIAMAVTYAIGQLAGVAGI